MDWLITKSMATQTIRIAPSVGTPSSCCETEGAQDYDVTLTVGEHTLEVEVTLVPSQYDGRLDIWGDVDNWITPDGVELIRALDRAGKVLATEIAAACRAGEASEVDVDLAAVEACAQASVEEHVEDIDRECRLAVAVTSAESWDESARSAYAHREDHVPDALAEAYYAAYAARGTEYAAELLSQAQEVA